MRYPGFIGSTDKSQSIIANCEVTMNWYVALLARSSKNQTALYPTPGQQSFVTVTDVGARALYSLNDRTFAVVGTGLHELNANGTTTLRGTVAQDNNQAQLTMNGAVGDQAFIASGTNGYNIDLTSNVLTTELTGDCSMVGMLDGYFIAFNPTTGRFRISDLNDGETWDPTQFAQRSDAPDDWIAMIVNAPDIWLLGSQTGSVFFDSGDFPFPFAARPGANFKYGIAAPFSLAAAGDSVLWVSATTEGAGIVVRATGYNPQPVSTPTLEAAIAGYEREFGISDAEAFTYQEDGHTFYVLSFPRARATWVYDLSTDLWHQRGKWLPTQNRYDIWTPRVHCKAFGKHLVGESGSGQISEMAVSIATESDGTEIVRKRIAPSIFNENIKIEHRRLEFFLEMGLGLNSGQGSDPKLMMRYSDDGGKTWSSELHANVGAMGKYRTRAYFNRLGIPRDRVYELTVSDPIPWRIIDAFINNDESRAA